MNKKILGKEELKKCSLKAISEIASVVKQTLGPGGNPIIIQRSGSRPDGTPLGPLVTKDGVTVAEHVTFRDPALNTIAQTIIEVAQNTVKVGGDGTTTSIVLAESIYKAGSKYMEQGVNSIKLYQGLQSAARDVIAEIEKLKTEITNEKVLEVARISSNGDEEVAKTVYDAIMAVGEDGYVSLEDGLQKETTLDVVDGAVYFQGWSGFSPQGSLMVNDESRDVCELVKPAVLLTAEKMDSIQDLHDLLANVWKMKSVNGEDVYTDVVPLFIIAHDYSDDVKAKILQARIKGKMPIAAIKSPRDGSPNARTKMLEDLAIMLGGKIVSQATGIEKLGEVTDDFLGCADRVEIFAKETVIYGGQGSEKDIMTRIEQLKRYKEETAFSEFDKENISLRIGKLSGGVAIVRVGGLSELEIREKRDRIEDALCAARVAIQDGVIPGGGYSFLKISERLSEDSVARKIMKEALTAPIKQIIANVGESSEVVLVKLPENKGYDARAKEYVDLLEAGIIDPAKVAKAAVENAVSIAGLLLTSGGALVSDVEPEDGKSNPLASMMGMM